MRAVTTRWPKPLGDRPRARAILDALWLCIGGFVAGLVGIIVLSVVLPAWITDTNAFRVVAGNQIQVGFAVFGLLYLYRSSNPGRFCKIRRPTWTDLAWIVVVAPLVFVVGKTVVTPGLNALGLPHPIPGGGEDIALAARPTLWPVAIVGSYLFAAPAEELVYRGIIHGRLREAFGVSGVVLLGATSFGLLHFIVGLVTAAVGFGGSLYWGLSAMVPGLLWGYAYEHTDNLLVPAVMHAMSWTIPFSTLIPFL